MKKEVKQLLQYLLLTIVKYTLTQLIIIIILFLCIGKVVISTGIVENMAYAGLVYYEEKRTEDLVTFAAAKDLNSLLEVTAYVMIIVTLFVVC